MGKIRKIRCLGCDSLDVISWRIREGKQRFKCKQCGLLLTRTNQGVSKKNRFIWLKEWIEGKQTFGQIAKKSGYSERTLKRYFYDYLSDYPTWQIRKKEKVNLLIDGTYFASKVCLILYRSDTIKATLFYRLTDGEWFEELVEDLSNLTSLGIEIDSVTCDGLSNIIKAVKKGISTDYHSTVLGSYSKRNIDLANKASTKHCRARIKVYHSKNSSN